MKVTYIFDARIAGYIHTRPYSVIATFFLSILPLTNYRTLLRAGRRLGAWKDRGAMHRRGRARCTGSPQDVSGRPRVRAAAAAGAEPDVARRALGSV